MSNSILKYNLIQDYHRWYHGGSKRNILLMFFRFICNDRLNYCLWFRCGCALYGKKGGWRILFWIISFLHYCNKHRLVIQIKIGTDIGAGIRFPHYNGIVLAMCHIGENCTIHQNVTIGRTFGMKDGCPTIGNNVIIFAGAVVVGNIKIGNNVIIGANSVVTHNVPDNVVVAGNPAKIISTDINHVINDRWHNYFYGYPYN